MKNKDKELLLYNSLKNLHLIEKTTKRIVVSDLLGLQAQFANNPKISLKLRCDDYSDEEWDEDLIKIWSHRSTMYVINKSDLALHLSANKKYGDFEDGIWGLTKKEYDIWSDFILKEMSNGNCTRDGLKIACTANGMSQELYKKAFNGWGGILKEMTNRGLITCCTGTKKEYILNNEVEFVDADEARGELIKRYFMSFGPATIEDCLYFFGSWKKTDVVEIIEEVTAKLRSIVIDNTTYFYYGQLETNFRFPDCVLVPGFDSLILGYKDRSRMMDEEHYRKVTNISGIICPTIIVRKKIRAGWKCLNNRVEVIPFEKLSMEDICKIERKIRKSFGKKTNIRIAQGL